MKKNLFINVFNLSLCALLLPFVITSCQKNAQEVSPYNSEKVTSSSQARRTGLSPVALKVTVNDASGYQITSDGGGDYVNGAQSVSVNFDQYGNFIFTCGTSGHGPSATMVRWLNVNFSSPIQVFINPPITGNDKMTAISTGSVAAYSFIPLQSLAVGQSECIGFTGGSGSGWVVNFHRSAEDVSSSPSAYAVVTRTSQTQWTMTPVGSCSPNSNVAALRNGPGTLYGYYNLPFFFTLTAQ